MEVIDFTIAGRGEDKRDGKNGYAGAFVPYSVLRFGFASFFRTPFSFEGPRMAALTREACCE
jgi:hypothetical protein